jgi:sugar-specific transcriptional regulator TrmB
MMDDVKVALAELGLAPKEAETYIAMLELGPASVQDIAKKAGINRTTTYVMMEGLKKHGLISTFERGKKTVFAAENPQLLIDILTRQSDTIQAKKNKLEASLPRLMAIFNTIDDKPKVRFLEGEASYQEIIAEVVKHQEEIWELYAVDEPLLEMIRMTQTHQRRVELTRRTKGRALISIKPGNMLPYFDTKHIQVREMDWGKHPFTGDITIVGNKVYVFAYKGRVITIVIDSKEITDIIRAIYEMAWSCAISWKPPADWEAHRLEK